MKYTDWKKLSKAERKTYLKSGGKVQTTPAQKAWVVGRMVLVCAFIAWGGHHLLSSPSKPDDEQLARHLVSKCVVEVGMKLREPDSMSRDRVQTVTRRTDFGYVTEFSFTANNAFGGKARHQAQCLFDTDQKLVSLEVK